MTLIPSSIARLGWRCVVRGAGLLAVPVLVAGALSAVSTPAKAQMPGSLGPSGSATANSSARANGQGIGRRPAALPGSKTDKSDPAPPDRAASDMAPNEALFDGINRGDMTYVKDAISRGAELDARNILGLTPIDLSVDLGRNDITFLLLSLRASEHPVSGPPSAKNRSAKADLQALAKAEAKAAKAPKGVRAAKEVAPPPPAAPKLFANDGGAPVPNAGFLGFGAQR